MHYMILIYSNEADWAKIPPADLPAVFEKWMGYGQALQAAGVFRAGSQLQPVATATTLRFQGGKVLSTDGPFAETKEQLGGYYLIETSDLDSALKWAGQCPGLFNGCTIEVRPLVPGDQPESPV
jgi:hypothetical protein